MQTKYSKKLPSLIPYMVLTLVIALFATGCDKSTVTDSSTFSSSSKEVETSVQSDNSEHTDYKKLGEGKTKFMFTIVDGEDSETQFEIHTDEETVGKALSELGLIEGENSTYGLYVKTVNGITLDYDKDGMYWAFYINDEYAQTGVDSTSITEGESYSFKAEKG